MTACPPHDAAPTAGRAVPPHPRRAGIGTPHGRRRRSSSSGPPATAGYRTTSPQAVPHPRQETDSFHLRALDFMIRTNWRENRIHTCIHIFMNTRMERSVWSIFTARLFDRAMIQGHVTVPLPARSRTRRTFHGCKHRIINRRQVCLPDYRPRCHEAFPALPAPVLGEMGQ